MKSNVIVQVATDSLFDRIGGLPRVRQIVDHLCNALSADAQLAETFRDIDMAWLNERQTGFLTQALGGSMTAAPKDLAGEPLDLRAEPFSRVLTHLLEALVSVRLPDPLLEDVLVAVASAAFRVGTR
jgi:truncated hemoglobin YjbI